VHVGAHGGIAQRRDRARECALRRAFVDRKRDDRSWIAQSAGVSQALDASAAPRNSRVWREQGRQARDRRATRVPHTPDRDGPARGFDDLAGPCRLEATAKLDELRPVTNQIHRDLDHSGLLRHGNHHAANSLAIEDESIYPGVGAWCFEDECPADHDSLGNVLRLVSWYCIVAMPETGRVPPKDACNIGRMRP
jgi:hypothetical protein